MGGGGCGSGGGGGAERGHPLLREVDEFPREGGPVQALLELDEGAVAQRLITFRVGERGDDGVDVVRRLGGERQGQAVVAVARDGGDAAGVGGDRGHAERVRL